MDGGGFAVGGFAVGGVAGIGVAAGAGFSGSIAASSQPAASNPAGEALGTDSAAVIVTISHAGLQALSSDTGSFDSAPASRLADDLAALALLALLERDRQRNDSLAAAAAAIASYLAVQAMTNR